MDQTNSAASNATLIIDRGSLSIGVKEQALNYPNTQEVAVGDWYDLVDG
jgi:hypothetical protein